MNNNSLAQFVALIKVSLARGKLMAEIPYSNLNLNLLKLLYYEGYIRGFRVLAYKKIYVFLKIANFKPTILDIAYFCPKNRHNYLPYKKLVSLYGLKNFCILSTNTGLLSIQQCFLQKKGGILVLLIK
jgi:ribosomal protein S8